MLLRDPGVAAFLMDRDQADSCLEKDSMLAEGVFLYSVFHAESFKNTLEAIKSHVIEKNFNSLKQSEFMLYTQVILALMISTLEFEVNEESDRLLDSSCYGLSNGI